MEVYFWLCLGTLLYIYAGYPVLAEWLSRYYFVPIQKSDIEPTVTVLISAYNEEENIEQTVRNKLDQDYPLERLSVIVVSDGSTDQTCEIVARIAEQAQGRLRLLRQEPRQGKTAALNLGIEYAQGDIVVFSDANSMYSGTAVRSLVRNFADRAVGYVTGRMVYTNAAGSGIGTGSGSYISYENRLRIAETKLGSIVGVDGGIDAIRRDLYRPMRADQLPDFVLPLSVVEQGKRVVYEENAEVWESALSVSGDEFRMRVRVALRAFWALYDKRVLLNPLRFGLFSWQLFSHKLLRYAGFAFLIAIFGLNLLVLESGSFYRWFLGAQLSAYALVVAGHMLRNSSLSSRFLFMPYYFFLINAACCLAFWKFVNREKMVLWKPRVGA